jgi:EAL domain-containing protein (putative c-di-GMP-specific phosphodiesterase class I)
VAALVASVVDLGRTLGMDVVAEGVETPAQLAALQGMTCRYLQGYLLGGPVAYSGLRTRLAEFDAAVLDGSEAPEVDTGVHIVGRGG